MSEYKASLFVEFQRNIKREILNVIGADGGTAIVVTLTRKNPTPTYPCVSVNV